MLNERWFENYFRKFAWVTLVIGKLIMELPNQSRIQQHLLAKLEYRTKPFTDSLRQIISSSRNSNTGKKSNVNLKIDDVSLQMHAVKLA